MLTPDQVIKEARLTEKSGDLTANLNKYTFEVFEGRTRKDVAQAIEKLFNVTVTRVNMVNIDGKVRRTRRGPIRRPGVRKAVVTLKSGDSITLV